MDSDSLRDLIRPLAGEAMIRFDEDTPLRLDGTPFEVAFNGTRYGIIAQDPGGLVDLWQTPERSAAALLSPQQMEIRRAMRAVAEPGLPLQQIAARAGLAEAPTWLTDQGRRRRLNRTTLSVQYDPSSAPQARRIFELRQPKTARLSLHKMPDSK
jgi:hypothetical protein